jgi:hypothetical protein
MVPGYNPFILKANAELSLEGVKAIIFATWRPVFTKTSSGLRSFSLATRMLDLITK